MITLRTKFRAALPRIITDGTFSIVALASSTTNTNRYTYAGDTVQAAASFPASASVTGAAGAFANTDLGLFFAMGGTTNGSTYKFSNDATVRFTMVASVGALGVGTGNDVKGLVIRAGASPGTNTTQTFTYATQTNVAGGTLTTTAYRPGACGTLTMAYIAMGGGAASVNTNKYTYATNTSAGGTAFQAAIWDATAASSGDEGIYRTGNTTVTTAKYTFASDVTSTGTSLLFNINGSVANAASGPSTTGIFNSSAGNAPTKYDYASNTVTAGSAFTEAVRGNGAMSNGTKGVTL